MKASTYMQQWVCYGGLWEQVGAIYQTLGQYADSWLMGYRQSGGEFLAEKP